MIRLPLDLTKYTPVYPNYKCMECGFVWDVEKFDPTNCVSCGNIYVEWTNHVESLASIGNPQTPHNTNTI